jgi:hypothetical protein
MLPTPFALDIETGSFPEKFGTGAGLVRGDLIDVLEQLFGEGDIDRGGLVHGIVLLK